MSLRLRKFSMLRGKRLREQLQAVSRLLGYLARCLLDPTMKVNISIVMGFLKSTGNSMPRHRLRARMNILNPCLHGVRMEMMITTYQTTLRQNPKGHNLIFTILNT
jgi:hypothetical protein